MAIIIAGSLVAGSVGADVAAADWTVKRDRFDLNLVGQLKRSIHHKPFDNGLLRQLHALYATHRSVELLVREYKHLHRRRPRSFAVAVVLARLLARQGNRAESLRYYEKAAAIRPGSVATQLRIGRGYVRAGKPMKARAAYRRALRSTRRRATKRRVLRVLARLATDAGDAQRVLKYYNRLIALVRRRFDMHMALARALTRIGQHAEALTALERARPLARTRQRRRQLATLRGDVHYSAQKHAAAAAAYRNAFRLAARRSVFRNGLRRRLIDAHRAAGELPELVTKLERRWAPGGRGHFEWAMLAELYQELGKVEQAIAAYRQAVRRAPSRLDISRRLIALLELSGRDAEALKLLRRTSRAAPAAADLRIELSKRY